MIDEYEIGQQILNNGAVTGFQHDFAKDRSQEENSRLVKSYNRSRFRILQRC